jgi:SAM-dependent methyltransferase
MKTSHRELVDRFLVENTREIGGRVLDIGGMKTRKRGSFVPLTQNVKSWEYANIDASTRPDYVCDAVALPLPDESVDWILLCEVLEHVEHPTRVLEEAFRVLKAEGRGVITMPFVFPIHSDPYDFQRWTDQKLHKVLEATGFGVLRLEALGGAADVILDLLLARAREMRRLAPVRSVLKLGMIRAAKALNRPLVKRPSERIVSGFGVVVEKRGP